MEADARKIFYSIILYNTPRVRTARHTFTSSNNAHSHSHQARTHIQQLWKKVAPQK